MKLYWWIWYPLCNGHETRWNKSVCDIASINFFEYNISWTIKWYFLSTHFSYHSVSFISNSEYLDFYALINSQLLPKFVSQWDKNFSHTLAKFGGHLLFLSGKYKQWFIYQSDLYYRQCVYLLNKAILQSVK